MRTTIKRIFTSILSLVLVLSISPIQMVFAADIVASGTCGENVTWSLDEDGLLTISGTGAMADYNGKWITAPWDNYKDDINTIVINEGLTRIGDYAFYQCSAATVTLNRDLQEIGKWALNNCNMLSTITIPGSVTTIGHFAFDSCMRLQSINVDELNPSYKSVGGVLFSADMKTLICFPAGKSGEYNVPEGVTTISERAFAYSESLSSISIPSSVSSIGERAFTCHKINGINVEDNNENYISENGVLFSKDMKTLIAFPSARTGAYMVPESVERIAETAFIYSKLSAVTLNEGLQEIGSEAFYCCYSLSEITIPNSISMIPFCAFSNDDLKTVTIGKNVRSIDSWAFNNCPIETVTFGGSEERWKSVNISKGNDALETASFTFLNEEPDPASEIASGTCGENVTWRLDEDGVLTISGTGAMDDYDWTNTAPWSEYRDDIKTIVINEGVTRVGDFAFRSYGVTKVTLNQDLREIGIWALNNCYSLTSITIPDSVRAIPSNAFGSSYQLKAVTIGKNVRSIDYEAFYSCPIETVTFGGTEARWNDVNIAAGNDTLKTASFTFLNEEPDPASEIASGTCGENVTWSFDEDGLLTISGTGAMDDYDRNTMPWYKYLRKIYSIVINEGVTHIGSNAFNSCNAITASLNQDLREIGASAFYNCYSLTSITIPANVTTIENGAFERCSSLNEITADEQNPAYKSVDGVLFSKELKTLVLFPGSRTGEYTVPEYVERIDNYAFYNSDLSAITLNKSLREIGESAFWNSNSITSITIPDSISIIPSSAFGACHRLAAVTIGKNVRSIDYEAFYSCPIETVTFGGTETRWNDVNIAAGNDALKTASFTFLNEEPDPATEIASGTCGESVTWSLDEDGLLTISGTGAMDDYDRNTMPWYAYKGSIIRIDIQDGITRIGDCAFCNLYKASTVNMTDSIVSIGNYAFESCYSISSVDILSNVSEIGSWAFMSCSSLTTITLPDGLRTIPNQAFSYCNSLKTVTIGKNLRKVEYGAFLDCPIENVTFGGTKERWDAININNCSGSAEKTS